MEIINVNINGFSCVDRIYSNDLNKDIMDYLEKNRYVNNSIFALLNDKKKELYVLRSDDEFEVANMASNFIKRYEDNLSDLHLFAIVISNYASLTSRLIKLECKLLKEKTGEDKNIGLIKKI